ncbi:MAG: TRAP transporter small permease [Fusobacteriaceae bacterium]|jgi:TRAP-type C4-dicarboxylate transport system permease small subunit|nr:TRAP transporter small permease [Fusobacteriaceae bacterium]
MKNLDKLGNTIDKAVNILIVIFFSVLISSCVLQVFTRYVLNKAFSWTEELARYTFIWANLLGAVICTKKGTHATVTALSEKYPPGLKRIVGAFIQVVVMLIALVMIRYGVKVTYMTIRQTSAAMKISMALVNSSIPICGILIFIHSFVHLVKLIEEYRVSERGDAK